MKKFDKSWAAAALLVLVAAMLCALAPASKAQGFGTISGTVLDISGKPWPGLTIEVVSEQGAKQDVVTDADGKYRFANLRPGVYTLTITKFPPPNDKQQPYQGGQLRVTSGEDQKADMNFKDIVAKQGAAAQEQVKKQTEEKQKFAAMKTHFDAGATLLAQEKQTRDDLAKAPTDQRDALKQKLTDLSNQAATEFQAAQQAASEKDPNRALIWGNLGQAYDMANRNEEAAQAYQQAITLKPDDASYYNNLGNVLARENKIDDARAAYGKSAELDPAHAAMAWRNFGITLFNAGRMKEAIEPLQKATQADPKSAQTWYLLGASLVGSIDTAKDCKTTGGKMDCKIPDGTVEAYQKAVELDPKGPYGTQASEGLEGLKAMSSGIDTRVNAKKKS
jgi:tetratricopeptide (TPR) repeat protein